MDYWQIWGRILQLQQELDGLYSGEYGTPKQRAERRARADEIQSEINALLSEHGEGMLASFQNVRDAKVNTPTDRQQMQQRMQRAQQRTQSQAAAMPKSKVDKDFVE